MRAVYSWGRGADGRLGLAHQNHVHTPTQMQALAQALKPARAHSASTTGEGAMCLSTDGCVFAWGKELQSSLTSTSQFVEVTKGLRDMAYLNGGGVHAASVSKHGRVYCWGARHYLDEHPTAPLMKSELPTNHPVRYVAAGGRHTLAALVDGTLFSWGSNDFGQLGNGSVQSSAGSQSTAIRVLDSCGQFPIRLVAFVAAGDRHSLCICDDGSLLAWGHNRSGQLGVEQQTDRSLPTAVCGELNGLHVEIVTAGFDHTSCVTRNEDSSSVQGISATASNVYSWGRNNYGQLGVGDTRDRQEPVAVRGLPSAAARVSAGDNHTIVCTAEGQIWSWGKPDFGRLGRHYGALGTEGDHTKPGLVDGVHVAVLQEMMYYVE